MKGKVYVNQGYVAIRIYSQYRESAEKYRDQYVTVVFLQDGERRRYRGKVWRTGYTYSVFIKERYADDFLRSLVGKEVEFELEQ